MSVSSTSALYASSPWRSRAARATSAALSRELRIAGPLGGLRELVEARDQPGPVAARLVILQRVDPLGQRDHEGLDRVGMGRIVLETGVDRAAARVHAERIGRGGGALNAAAARRQFRRRARRQPKRDSRGRCRT